MRRVLDFQLKKQKIKYMKKIFALINILSVLFFNCYAENSSQLDETYICKKNVLVITDYVKNDGKTDVSDAIQKVIDNNPNRTIYFPDGIYLLSKPIKTPANPQLSVSLELSNYAILKASENWSDSEAMVRLGAIHSANNIFLNGSVYGISGGIIDCSGKAKAISVDGGRETYIRNLSIKSTKLGIHIKRGANSGSSDCDIISVNIVGDKSPESIGILVEGYDNTFTNMRIYATSTGVILKSSGNNLRNIHPLYAYSAQSDYTKGVAFLDEKGSNWYDYCYSDNFATGFVVPNTPNIYKNCFIFWYTDKGGTQTAFEVAKNGKLNSIISDIRVGFHRKSTNNTFLKAQAGGKGVVENVIISARSKIPENDIVKSYLKGMYIVY